MFDSPDDVIGLAAAVAIIPLIVAHLKGFARALHVHILNARAGAGYEFPAIGAASGDSVWPLVCDLVAVAWAVGLWQSGHGPAWLAGWATCILAGFALGVAASKARDLAQAITAGKPGDSTSPVSGIGEPTSIGGPSVGG